jgi:hypothetical protein
MNDACSSSRDELEDREGRITIDLDAKDYSASQFRLKATQIWHNLKDDASDVEVHVSSSGLGLHFVAWFDESLQFYEEVVLRRQHCDDPRRIDMDVQRWLQGLYTGVLFEEKSNRAHEKERRFRDIYDALDWIDNQRDDASRIQRLAQDGHKGAPDLAPRADL